MNIKIIGFFIFMLLIGTILPTTGILTKTVIGTSNSSENNNLMQNDIIGIRGVYKSRFSILSPDGNNYSCIMYCNDHPQTLEWISLVNQQGFEKAWQKQFIRLIILFILPGSVILFGLDDFRLWYLSLFIKHRHNADFLNCLNNYDELNGTGIITYEWTSGLLDKGYNFQSQPDNTWIENSWVLNDDDVLIPNPEIWNKYAPLPVG